jgi:hypothetical protein
MVIISSIDTLKQYIPTIAGNDFAKYTQYVDDAEAWLMKEITGKLLFDIINEDNEELLDYARAIVANKAYGDGIPFFDLVENESGFAVVSNTNLAPASQQRVAALQAATYRKLDEAVESLLEYLEETVSFHDEWKGSPAYTLLSNLYLTTVKEFRRYVVYPGSRREFMVLKPEMLNAINLKIAPVISQQLSDQIIEQLRDDDLTEDNKAILENLRFSFANFTMKQEDTAQLYLSKVRRLIVTSPDKYQAFRDSEIYINWLAAQKVTAVNNADSPLFFAGL